jgi:hypothetical protein
MRRDRMPVICTGFMAGCLLAGIDTARTQQPNPAVDNVFSDLSKPGSPGCAIGVATAKSFTKKDTDSPI